MHEKLSEKQIQKYTKIYKNFTTAFSDCCSSGVIPAEASQDTHFFLELQNNKLQKNGLAVSDDMKLRINGSEMMHFSRSDGNYICDKICSHFAKKTKYSKDGRELYTFSDRITMYATITDTKTKNISSKTPLCCPKCGAPQTVGQLKDGCDYCDTKFTMSELYPKVTNFFITRDYMMTSDELKKEIGLFVLAGMLIFGIMGAFKAVMGGGIGEIIAGLILGLIAGYVIWALSKLVRILADAGRSLPILLRCLDTRSRIERTMFRYDPDFSNDHFIDRVMALFKIIAYRDENIPTVWKGKGEPPVLDIIDTMYGGAMAVNSIKTDADGMCDISIDLFLTNIHYKENKIRKTDDVYRMGIRKNIKKPANFGFSFKAVSCPNCGGSFDAMYSAKCPYCGNIYDIESDEWIVTSLKKV